MKAKLFFNFILLFFVSSLLGLFFACFKVNFNDSRKEDAKDFVKVNTGLKDDSTKVSVNNKKHELLKVLAEELRFLANVEREVVKILRPQFSVSMLPFEVLSTVLDQNAGIKKNFARIDCRLYQIKWLSDEHLQIERQCQKPYTVIADIKNLHAANKEVIFHTRQWASVLGNSVALTAPNRTCTYKVENEKIKTFQCENTVFGLSETSAVEELRLDQWLYQSKDLSKSGSNTKTSDSLSKESQQVMISGGIYKDLVEHRKIKMSIPFEGKIKVIEKALKVRDDFAELAEGQIQNPSEENQNGSTKEKNQSEKNQSEKNHNEDKQESHQKGNPENQGVPPPETNHSESR